MQDDVFDVIQFYEKNRQFVFVYPLHLPYELKTLPHRNSYICHEQFHPSFGKTLANSSTYNLLHGLEQIT